MPSAYISGMVTSISSLDSFAPRIVAWLDGSLPGGGFEPETPIYGVEQASLLAPDGDPTPAVTPLDLGDKTAFYIDDVITRDEAARFIGLTEGLGYRAAAPGIHTPPGMRQNKTVHFIAPADDMAIMHRRLAPVLPQELEGRRLSDRLSHRVNMYRYDDGDVFNPHIDGDWPGFGLNPTTGEMEQWSGTNSMLTMVLYLNGHEDGIDGGDTVLFDDGEPKVSVSPKTGRALFFRHGQTRGSVLHAGAPIRGRVSKYVARINVMFDL